MTSSIMGALVPPGLLPRQHPHAPQVPPSPAPEEDVCNVFEKVSLRVYEQPCGQLLHFNLTQIQRERERGEGHGIMRFEEVQRLFDNATADHVRFSFANHLLFYRSRVDAAYAVRLEISSPEAEGNSAFRFDFPHTESVVAETDFRHKDCHKYGIILPQADAKDASATLAESDQKLRSTADPQLKWVRVDDAIDRQVYNEIVAKNLTLITHANGEESHSETQLDDTVIWNIRRETPVDKLKIMMKTREAVVAALQEIPKPVALIMADYTPPEVD